MMAKKPTKAEAKKALEDFVKGSLSKKLAAQAAGYKMGKGELGEDIGQQTAEYFVGLLDQVGEYLAEVDEITTRMFEEEKAWRLANAKSKPEKLAAKKFGRPSFDKMMRGKNMSASAPEASSMVAHADMLKDASGRISQGQGTAQDYMNLMPTLKSAMGNMKAIGDKDDPNAPGVSMTATEMVRQRKLAQKFNQDILDKQAKELSDNIDEGLDKYVAQNLSELNDKIAHEGTNSLKLGLAAFLGPAAPLVQLLDESVGLEKMVSKRWTTFQKKYLRHQVEADKATVETQQQVANVAATVENAQEAQAELDEEKTKQERSFFMRMFGKLNRTTSDVSAAVENLEDNIDRINDDNDLPALKGLSKLLGPMLAFMGPVMAVLGTAAAATALGSFIYDQIKDNAGFTGAADKVFGALDNATGKNSGNKYTASKSGQVYTPTDARVSAALDSGAKEFGIDRGELYATAYTESSFKADAKAGKGSAAGLFQFTKGTWDGLVDQNPEYAKKYGITKVGTRGIDQRLDPNKSMAMYNLLRKSNKGMMGGRTTGDEATDAYMSHFLGAPGAKSFLKKMEYGGNNMAAKDMVSPGAYENNKELFHGKNGELLTGAQFVQNLRSKSGDRAAAYNDFFAQQAGVPTGGAAPAVPPAGAAGIKPTSPSILVPPGAQASAGAPSGASGGGAVNVETVPMYVNDDGLMVVAAATAIS